MNRVWTLVRAFAAAYSTSASSTASSSSLSVVAALPLPSSYKAQGLFSDGTMEAAQASGALSDAEILLLRQTAEAVVGVTKELDRHVFNVAIAKLMTLSNQIYEFLGDKSVATSSSSSSSSSSTTTPDNESSSASGAVAVGWQFNKDKVRSPAFRESLLVMARLLSPLAPHLSAEMYELMQSAYYNITPTVASSSSSVPVPAHAGVSGVGIMHEGKAIAPELLDVHRLPWMTAHSSWLKAAEAVVTVSANGKLRFVVQVPVDVLNEGAAAELQTRLLANQTLQKRLVQEKDINPSKARKIICKITKVDEGAMINFVL